MTRIPRGSPPLEPDASKPAVLYVRLPHATAAEMARVIPVRERSAWVRGLIEKELHRLAHGPWPELGER